MVSFEIIFRVCELHFRLEDIKRESSAFDKKPVKLLQLNLKDHIFMMVLYLGFFQTVPLIYLHRPPLESHQTQRKFKGKILI